MPMNLGVGCCHYSIKGPIDAPQSEATMVRAFILGLAAVATIAAVTVAAAV